MRVYSIICEYNPFHNGHKYLIDQVKNEADTALIAVMSGSFTQRGDAAVADKFTRAEIAVKNGADMVIELPTVYACAPAQTFAKGAVQIIKNLGVVDGLCFGAENDDIALLREAAELFENEIFLYELKRNMEKGDYYPRAVADAAEAQGSPALSELLGKPNNILAVEYIRALSGSGIKPVAIKRIGAAHDSSESVDNIASASYIRELILSGEDYSGLIPNYTIQNPADIKRLEQAMLYKLRTMSADDIKKLPDISEGLENRIYEAVRTSTEVTELLTKIKTKRYTMARIRRILIYALLNITEELPKTDAPYARVLAFSDKGATLMSEINRKCPLPLITNVADGYKSLDGIAKRIFDIDILATDIHALAQKNKGVCGADFTKGVIKL